MTEMDIAVIGVIVGAIPLGTGLYHWNKKRIAERRDKYQKLIDLLGPHLSELQQGLISITANGGSLRIAMDLQDYHRKFNDILNDREFWEFSGGPELRDRVRGFHQEFAKSQTEHQSILSFRDQVSFAVQKGEALISDLLHRLN